MTPTTIDQPSFIASETIGRVNGNRVKYVPAGTGPSYWGPADRITFLITGEETGGAFFMGAVSVPPDAGVPPHIHHREDEFFHILEGRLTVHVGEKILNALPGDFVRLPRGIVHCFQNTGAVETKFLVLATPAGIENFFEEAFYSAADSPARPPLDQRWMDRLLAAASRHGLEFLPPA